MIFKLPEGEHEYYTGVDDEKVSEYKRETYEAFLKIKKVEVEKGFTDKNQIKLLNWFDDEGCRDISFDYERQIQSEKTTYADYRKNWKYDEERNFDLFCENSIFSYEEFLNADEQTIRGIASCSILLGGESEDEEDYWSEQIRMRDLVIFNYISSEGEENFFKRIGWDLSDTQVYKNLHTGCETTLGVEYSQEAFEKDGIHRHKTRMEWLLHDLHTFFEHYTMKERWNDKGLMDKYKPKQATLFGSSTDDDLSDEELAKKYPVESGEVDDEDIDEELVEDEEGNEKNSYVEQKAQQTSLFGGVAEKPLSKEKILLAEQEHLNQIWWLKHAIDTIAEVDSGKIFDNNERDGLSREYEIGSAGFEELGLTEEDFEALTYEQYVKKCLEQIIKFNIEEMAMDIEQAELFSYERIENRLEEIEKELELCKTKMKDTKVGEMIVQKSLM